MKKTNAIRMYAENLQKGRERINYRDFEENIIKNIYSLMGIINRFKVKDERVDYSIKPAIIEGETSVESERKKTM